MATETSPNTASAHKLTFAPASILFVMTRREQGRRLFSLGELVILAVSVIGAIIGIVALATGSITI